MEKKESVIGEAIHRQITGELADDEILEYVWTEAQKAVETEDERRFKSVVASFSKKWGGKGDNSPDKENIKMERAAMQWIAGKLYEHYNIVAKNP